jgi:hypothetical protein
MPIGQKHLIKCRCVLPQFKSKSEPPAHQFIVFSIINDDGTCVPKYSQCNNCGTLHKVTDICKSDVLVGKEYIKSLLTVEDIKSSLSSNVVSVLENNNVDIATWEAVQFAIENKRWGEIVVLSTDAEGDEIHGKYIKILGETLFKIESFMRSTGVLP